MNRINIKSGIIYGPVHSRRLGISLGINLLGNEEKKCTFNCKYCECGWTESDVLDKNKKINYPKVNEVIESLVEELERINIDTDYFTFSGNGEPTLHPEFPRIIEEVIRIRNKKSLKTKIALLSNSTTINRPEIIRAMDRLDEKIMKLDAGNVETYESFNSPICRISLDEVVEGLKKIKNLTVKAFFAKGSNGNYSKENIDDWCERIKDINPELVQIYTLDRECSSEKIFPLNSVELSEIESLLKRGNINVNIY